MEVMIFLLSEWGLRLEGEMAMGYCCEDMQAAPALLEKATSVMQG